MQHIKREGEQERWHITLVERERERKRVMERMIVSGSHLSNCPAQHWLALTYSVAVRHPLVDMELKMRSHSLCSPA